MGVLPSYDRLWPVTITPDRYGGTYSGGVWLAFPLNPSAVPDGPFGSDVFANDWWSDIGDPPIGRGATPDGAYDDLGRRLEAIRPTQTSEPRDEFSGTTWTWELHWPAGQVTTIARWWRGMGEGPQLWEE
jgi:hypothetical protein